MMQSLCAVFGLIAVAEGLKVIGAGPGRTGTDSMKMALIHLGFGPTYHMKELLVPEQGVDTTGHMQFWTDYAAGKPVDVQATLAGFDSGVDYPMSLYTEQLIKEYPDSKVILTVRSTPAAWFNSINSSICNFQGESWYMKILTMLPIPPFSKFSEQFAMMDSATAMAYGKDRTFEAICADEAKAVEVYEAWNAKITALVPPERLLIFQTGKHGYKELAEFLKVAVPEEEFPYVNSKAEMANLIFGMKAAATLFVWIWLSPFMFIGYCLCCRAEFGIEEATMKKKYSVEEMRKIMSDTKDHVAVKKSK